MIIGEFSSDSVIRKVELRAASTPPASAAQMGKEVDIRVSLYIRGAPCVDYYGYSSLCTTSYTNLSIEGMSLSGS
jgi:hypothetical protein